MDIVDSIDDVSDLQMKDSRFETYICYIAVIYNLCFLMHRLTMAMGLCYFLLLYTI